MAPLTIDFEKVCRLCFREDDGGCKMTSIFEQDLEETIRKCVQIEVLIGNDEPSNICASCMLSLDSWTKFKILCDNTNAFLQQYLQEKNETDLVFNSEITFLGTLGFTPSQMSDLSIGFLESDSLWNNSISQQWSEVDPICTDLPIPRCMKKVQPPDDLITETISSEECMDMALNVISKKDENFTFTKAHWWNPKAISMKTHQKEKKKASTINEISKSMVKYNQYSRKTYYCNVCPETFTKFNDLISHDSTVHIDMTQNFNCNTCGKLFLCKDRLEIHKKVHREKLFECQMCQKKFIHQKTLDNHLNVHIGLYTCQTCSYKAPSSYNLKIHENTHSLVKNFNCNKCDRICSTLSSLRRHDRLVHKKLALYHCEQCNYSTNQPTTFKHHKSFHTSHQFICDYCGSCFKSRDLFLIHIKLHKDAQFNCSHCKKSFKKKSRLKEHLISIHKLGLSKKFKCEECEKWFSNARNLRVHKKKLHSI